MTVSTAAPFQKTTPPNPEGRDDGFRQVLKGTRGQRYFKQGGIFQTGINTPSRKPEIPLPVIEANHLRPKLKHFLNLKEISSRFQSLRWPVETR